MPISEQKFRRRIDTAEKAHPCCFIRGLIGRIAGATGNLWLDQGLEEWSKLLFQLKGSRT